MGSWDKAIIKSIGWGLLIVVFYYFFEVGFPGHSASDFAILFFLFLGVYLVLSFGGWLLIGLPLHYLLFKLSKTNFIYYPVVATLFGIVLWPFTNVEAAILFGLSAIFQAVVFRYYVFKT